MRYETPDSVESAVSLLANGAREPRVLAGGTDLLVQLRAGMIDPDLIVDIKNIRETRQISAENMTTVRTAPPMIGNDPQSKLNGLLIVTISKASAPADRKAPGQS